MAQASVNRCHLNVVQYIYRFQQVLRGTLGFTSESLCWNISQKAVQNIVSNTHVTH